MVKNYAKTVLENNEEMFNKKYERVYVSIIDLSTKDLLKKQRYLKQQMMFFRQANRVLLLIALLFSLFSLLIDMALLRVEVQPSALLGFLPYLIFIFMLMLIVSEVRNKIRFLLNVSQDIISVRNREKECTK